MQQTSTTTANNINKTVIKALLSKDLAVQQLFIQQNVTMKTSDTHQLKVAIIIAVYLDLLNYQT